MKVCGIYLIEIDRGAKAAVYYVGQSVHIAERRMSHLRALRAKRHDNTYMQNAFAKYGESAFSFRTLLICSAEHLCLYEQAVLDWYRAVYGLRVANVMVECIRAPFGVKRRPETILRMSLSQKGRKKPPEQIAKMALTRLGQKHTEATKQKLSDYHKGRQQHPNSIAAFEIARATSRVEGLRKAFCGKPRVHSEETKQKIAASLRGRTSCPLANEKRRLSQLGRKSPPEVVAKRVATRLANAMKKQADAEWSRSKAGQP